MPHSSREEQYFDREEVLGRDAASVFPTEAKKAAVDNAGLAELLGAGKAKFISETEARLARASRRCWARFWARVAAFSRAAQAPCDRAGIGRRRGGQSLSAAPLCATPVLRYDARLDRTSRPVLFSIMRSLRRSRASGVSAWKTGPWPPTSRLRRRVRRLMRTCSALCAAAARPHLGHGPHPSASRELTHPCSPGQHLHALLGGAPAGCLLKAAACPAAPPPQILREAKEAKEAAFQEQWKMMKQARGAAGGAWLPRRAGAAAQAWLQQRLCDGAGVEAWRSVALTQACCPGTKAAGQESAAGRGRAGVC